MESKEILHVLRNPYGYTDEKIKEAILVAADKLEGWQEVYQNLLDWAEKNGVDTMTYNRQSRNEEEVEEGEK